MKPLCALALVLLVVTGCERVDARSTASPYGAGSTYESRAPSQAGETAIGAANFAMIGLAYAAMLAVMIPLSN